MLSCAPLMADDLCWWTKSRGVRLRFHYPTSPERHNTPALVSPHDEYIRRLSTGRAGCHRGSRGERGAASGARSAPGCGRTASRSRVWRSGNQRSDGARRGGSRKSNDAGREDCRRPCRARARDRGLSRRGFTVAPAKPGFINIRLAPEIWHAQLRAVLRAGTAFGDSVIGGGERVNVEFVSANPTGPMHVRRGRGAVVGDALAGLLSKAGLEVQREYYINDAGAQVDILARSAYLRYREALAEAIGPIPEGFYPGEYLIETGRALAERDGRKWLGRPEAEWLGPIRDFAVKRMMALIRDDLALLGVRHDLFVSERSLTERGAIDDCVKVLADRELVYAGVLEPPKGKLPDDWEPRPQTLFRATSFGDEVDRPLKKSDGSWTYFAADIA